MDTTKNAVIAAETTSPVVVIAEPTSPKLTELKVIRNDLAKKLTGIEPDSKDFADTLEALQQNRKDQSAEIFAIKKADADQKLADLRQERVKFIETFKSAVLAAAAKGAGDVEKSAEQASYETLVNLVLPNHATKSAIVSDKESGSKGDKTAKIYDELKNRIDGGMTPSAAVKEVVALGNAIGTVGSVRTKHWPVAK